MILQSPQSHLAGVLGKADRTEFCHGHLSFRTCLCPQITITREVLMDPAQVDGGFSKSY